MSWVRIQAYDSIEMIRSGCGDRCAGSGCQSRQNGTGLEYIERSSIAIYGVVERLMPGSDCWYQIENH